MLQGQRNVTDIGLQFEATGCQIHHSALIRSNSQNELDRSHQLHVLDITEVDKDIPYERTRCSIIMKK
jgi:hypothetical protein